jgi:acyl carrier protein
MERDKVVKLVNDAILEVICLTPDKYTQETTFEELKADSLDVVKLAMYIEDCIGKDIQDVDLKTIKTVGDLVTFLEQHY